MKTKTIKKIIVKKLNEWLKSITDTTLVNDVRANIVVSGGSIASMLLKADVNDYDIYIQDVDVLRRLAEYYSPGKVLDGRKRAEYIENRFPMYNEEEPFWRDTEEPYAPELLVRLLNLKPDQIKLDIPSVGEKYEVEPLDEAGNKVYKVVFLSQNAISLSNDIQIVLRFSGTVQ